MTTKLRYCFNFLYFISNEITPQGFSMNPPKGSNLIEEVLMSLTKSGLIFIKIFRGKMLTCAPVSNLNAQNADLNPVRVCIYLVDF